MNYTQTDLSIQDTQILKKIYIELEKIKLRRSFVTTKCDRGHALRTGTTDQPDARQSIFKKNKPSLLHKKYPHIMDLFEEFISLHYPKFKFSTVYVNKNTISKKHLDSRNTGESLIVGFGNYSEGQTILYDNDNNDFFFDIQKKSLIFNGSKIYHGSTAFQGVVRYSIVFF